MRVKKLLDDRQLKPNRPFYQVLPEAFIDPKLLHQLSHDRCVAWRCLPICEDSVSITVATSQEFGILDLEPDLQEIFAKKVNWVLCSDGYLSAAIERTFSSKTPIVNKTGSDGQPQIASSSAHCNQD